MSISETIRQEDDLGLASDPEAIRRVPARLALAHDVLALAWDGDELAIAVPEGPSEDAADRVRFATGARVRVVPAPREAIRRRLARVYGGAPLERLGAEESPVVRVLDDVLRAAVEAGASDVHLEPQRDGGRVRFRIAGRMHVDRAIPAPTFDRIVARMKHLAGMDVADRRQPQDGRYAFGDVDARVASLPAQNGEKVVVRLLGATAALPLDRLGMDPQTLRNFRAVLRRPHGCVLVAGPTGSGKTTTLYAALRDLDGAASNLCSIEDPVEVEHPDVTQVQICPKGGTTFASALRAIVRQDPDVVMIGEIRDPETAHAAMSAALAGHLVITSIHAGSAAGALERLVELGVSRRTIAGAVRAVLSQRLMAKGPTAAGASLTGAFEFAEIDGRGRAEAVSGDLAEAT